MENDDGVKRDQLDYRAGWIESLQALITSIQVNGVRCKKSEVAGLELALRLAQQQRTAMIQKMKGGAS